MAKTSIFNELSFQDQDKLLNDFKARSSSFSKGVTIMSNLRTTRDFNIVKSGIINIIRFNYNGTRTIIETLEEDDIFGHFSSATQEELYVIAETDAEIISFNYDQIFQRYSKNIDLHYQFNENVVKILANKLQATNDRIQILTEKTIRNKLLNYFNSLYKKNLSKNITVPFSLTNLADYLSIDRSAMMRELKNLKDEGLINQKGKKIQLLYYIN
jgi:CRP-like cAMP-binding protein